MPSQFLDVPDRISLRQVPGKLLVGRAQDGTLIPIVVDDSGILELAAGPGNDYSGMTESFKLVPDRQDLKQVGGSMLVGRTADGTLLPVAVDDNGRLIATGGGAGASGVLINRAAPTGTYGTDEPPPSDPTSVTDLAFLSLDANLRWQPSVLHANGGYWIGFE